MMPSAAREASEKFCDGGWHLTLACFRGRCMAVILSRLRQLPAFWDAQQQSKWEPATKQIIQTGHPDVGPLDDLEVPGLFACPSQSQDLTTKSMSDSRPAKLAVKRLADSNSAVSRCNAHLLGLQLYLQSEVAQQTSAQPYQASRMHSIAAIAEMRGRATLLIC